MQQFLQAKLLDHSLITISFISAYIVFIEKELAKQIFRVQELFWVLVRQVKVHFLLFSYPRMEELILEDITMHLICLFPWFLVRKYRPELTEVFKAIAAELLTINFKLLFNARRLKVCAAMSSDKTSCLLRWINLELGEPSNKVTTFTDKRVIGVLFAVFTDVARLNVNNGIAEGICEFLESYYGSFVMQPLVTEGVKCKWRSVDCLIKLVALVVNYAMKNVEINRKHIQLVITKMNNIELGSLKYILKSFDNENLFDPNTPSNWFAFLFPKQGNSSEESSSHQSEVTSNGLKAPKVDSLEGPLCSSPEEELSWVAKKASFSTAEDILRSTLREKELVIDDIELSISELKDELRKVEIEHANVKTNLAETQAERENNEDQVKKLKEQNDELQKAIRKLNDEYKTMEEESERLDINYDALVQLSKQLIMEKSVMKRMKTACLTSHEQMQATLKDLENKMEYLEARDNELVDQLRKTLESLTSEKSDVKRKNSTLQEEYEWVMGIIQEQKKFKHNIGKRINSLKATAMNIVLRNEIIHTSFIHTDYTQRISAKIIKQCEKQKLLLSQIKEENENMIIQLSSMINHSEDITKSMSTPCDSDITSSTESDLDKQETNENKTRSENNLTMSCEATRMGEEEKECTRDFGQAFEVSLVEKTQLEASQLSTCYSPYLETAEIYLSTAVSSASLQQADSLHESIGQQFGSSQRSSSPQQHQSDEEKAALTVESTESTSHTQAAPEERVNESQSIANQSFFENSETVFQNLSMLRHINIVEEMDSNSSDSSIFHRHGRRDNLRRFKTMMRKGFQKLIQRPKY